MTVTTTANLAIYNGDGATVAFPTTFEFFDAGDIVVTERVIATGVETVKTLTTDYTVSGGSAAAGTVTAVTAPPSTVQWAIGRKTPLTQQIDYVENDDFPAETHEQGLDRGVMIAQDRQGELDRALKVPVSDPASSIGELPNSVDRASQFLSFDAAGKPIPAAAVTGAAVSAFIKTMLDDATAAAARTTLGALGKIVDDLAAKLGSVLNTNGFAIDESEGAAVASAATTDIWATDGNTLHITGTATITSFGTAPRIGAWRTVIFNGALTLTDGANLNLPGAANITTAVDDFAFVWAETTTLLKVLYFKADGTAVVATSPTISQEFISADQTITSGGQLTLAHGLSAAPKIVQIRLKNTTAAGGYSVNDEVIINPAENDPGGGLARGISVVPDGTNITFRFGSDVLPMAIIRKDTGAAIGVTPANWKLIARAWA